MVKMFDAPTNHSFLSDSSGMDDIDRPLPLILPLYMPPSPPVKNNSAS